MAVFYLKKSIFKVQSNGGIFRLKISIYDSLFCKKSQIKRVFP